MSWDENSGWRQYDYFVPNGARRDMSTKMLIVLGEDIGDYTVSDCTAPVLSRLAEDLEKYQLCDIYSVEGKNVQGEQYMEFYADEEALDALILELFYAQKK